MASYGGHDGQDAYPMQPHYGPPPVGQVPRRHRDQALGDHPSQPTHPADVSSQQLYLPDQEQYTDGQYHQQQQYYQGGPTPYDPGYNPTVAPLHGPRDPRDPYQPDHHDPTLDDPFNPPYQQGQPDPYHPGAVNPAHDPLGSNRDSYQLPDASVSSFNVHEQHLLNPGHLNPESGPSFSAIDDVNDPDRPLLSAPGRPAGHLGDSDPSNQNDEESLVRYGRIPQRQPRRHRTIRRVELYHGNLVFDCQVPPKLLQSLPRKEEREFTHMRYTAATCDPDDFKDERYSLRQVLYDVPRRTELFIVLTMYNEDEVLFCRTMHGVMKSIQHLCSRNRSKVWGPDGWQKVVVCIVSDGRAKINARTLSVLAAMGVYQDGVAKNVVAGKPVTAHIYEYTTQISIDPDLKFKSADRGLVPVQILFCLKEKNAKKINSHRWFFNAFAPILMPNVCVLLDVGTQPGPTSIYKLWKTFDLNSNVGGACGEIVALKGKYFKNLLNPLVAAQNFEYKTSNILDKPLESVFGYITVLPGAFSAYRYIALQNNQRGEGPLKEYFKGETLHHDPDADLWTKNMYLAEDRILCWELVAKRGSAWLLSYQRSAYAVTDVPDRVADLIAQRRRWLNGSFFAALHSIYHFGYLYRSDHTITRKWFLHIELFYQVFNMVFAWFALANWYIIFIILTQSLADKSFGIEGINVVNVILKYIYLALIVMCFLLALGNRPQGSKKFYTGIMVSFALLMAYMLFAAVFITVKAVISAKEAIEADGGKFVASDVFTNSIFRNIVVSLLSTYGLYLVAALIFLDPAHMLTSFVQYLLLSPSFTNIINVYAFCNVQDVTWGNRPEEKQQTDLGVASAKDNVAEVVVSTDEQDINAAYDDAVHVLSQKAPPVKSEVDLETKTLDSYRAIRTNVVLAWALTNGALAAAILSTSAGSNLSTSGRSTTVNGYMAFLLFSVAALAAFRFVGCFTYSIMWLFQNY